MLESRRVADDEDDLAIFLGTPSTVSQSQNEPEETDELGRVLPRANPEALRRERRLARTARRLRRQQTRALSRTGANAEGEEEGYSTDSSLPPSDAADYETAIDRISRDARDVLSDVRAEEFRKPLLGLGKWFGQWRSKFDDTYTGAWGGLGMVGAWEFWARLEIVAWDPIKVRTSYTILFSLAYSPS
jgi:GC-rich sequence DNA-binding factor